MALKVIVYMTHSECECVCVCVCVCVCQGGSGREVGRVGEKENIISHTLTQDNGANKS